MPSLMNAPEVREKGALGTGSGDHPRTSGQLPIALEFRTPMPMKKEVGGDEGKANDAGCSPKGEHRQAGSFVSRFLPLSCRSKY